MASKELTTKFPSSLIFTWSSLCSRKWIHAVSWYFNLFYFPTELHFTQKSHKTNLEVASFNLSNLVCIQIPDLAVENCESIWSSLKLVSYKNIYLATFYRFRFFPSAEWIYKMSLLKCLCVGTGAISLKFKSIQTVAFWKQLCPLQRSSHSAGLPNPPTRPWSSISLTKDL